MRTPVIINACKLFAVCEKEACHWTLTLRMETFLKTHIIFSDII